jgi:hypothetical protein
VLDKTRTGVARGIVVVPEFPSSIMLASSTTGTSTSSAAATAANAFVVFGLGAGMMVGAAMLMQRRYKNGKHSH